ncbi:MAG: DUF3084 domain-containing protein [Armatimonadetes bacterium]|nr:DUF3084 domain-containing protein [Armatimonadota bacterium]
MRLPTSLVIIGTLLVVSGVIAYIGDIVGKRMGKKRLSLLGLRPRQTGTVMSITTGIVIQLVSIAALTIVSQSARLALFRFDFLRQESARLHREISNLNTERKRLGSDVTELRSNLSETKLSLTKAHDDLSQKTLTLQQKQRDVTRLEGMLRRLQDQLGRVQQVRRQVEAHLVKARRQSKEAQTRYLTARGKYYETLGKYRETKSDFKVLATDLQERKKDLEATKADLATAQKARDEKSKELAEKEKEVENAEGILGRLWKEMNASSAAKELLDNQLQALKQDQQALEEEIDKRKDEKEKLVTSLQKVVSYFGMKVVAERGEILVSSVIPAGQSVEGTKVDLEILLKKARDLVINRGAKGQDSGPALSIVSRYVEGPDGRKTYFHEEHVVNFWAEKISKSTEDAIVEVVAVFNSVEGNPVDADFRGYPNVLVFHKGEALLTESLNGRDPSGSLFRSILGTLEKIRGVAREKGMRGGVENRYGEISYEELFEVLASVRRLKSAVTLKITAKEDTHAAGPLQIQIKVERPKKAVGSP